MEATSLQPGVPATPGPTTCGRQSLIQAQTVWPMPFIAIAVWAAAPLISYVGVRRKMAGPFVLLPLFITTAIALGSRSGRAVAAT
jgi:hypothetical protein